MENKDKFYEEKYLISSPYYKKDSLTNILVASDIHYHEHVDKELYKLLVSYCRETKPDFIVMPGDLIETTNFLTNMKEKEFFEGIIRELAEIAPVIIVPGNHEMASFDVQNFRKRLENNKIDLQAIRYFESLNKIKNVYFLNNEQTMINDVLFLGFSPSLATYLKVNEESIDTFIEDYIKSGLKMAEGCYNALITHSPIMLTNDRVLNSVYDFKNMTDLVVSGHLHDGYVPKFMDKYIGNSNAGLFLTPLKAPIPGMLCRGVHDFGRGYIFISQGFRKYTADIRLFNSFEKITANDVERLIISKESEKSVKKL